MNIFALLLCTQLCIEYSLSTDKKTFTAFVSVNGISESLTSNVVQDSKLHTNYVTVIVSEGINSLESQCFSGCTKLQNVTLAGTVTSIGFQAFYRCSSLVKIEFPYGTKILKDEVMESCTSLTVATFPSTLESVGKLIFMFTNIQEINIAYNERYQTNEEKTILVEDGKTLKEIAYGLKSITIPKEIVTLAGDSMSYRSSLKNVYFEANSCLKTVSSRVFYQSGIISLELPNGTSTILSNAFLQASELKSIYFPSTITEIHTSCLTQTDSLTNVTIGPNCSALETDKDGVVFLRSDHSILFMPISIKQFTISNKTLDITPRLLQSRKHLTLLMTEDEYHPKFLAYNNTLYNKDTMELIACIGGATRVDVHPNCTSIGSASFDSVDIEKVDLSGTNVTKIGSQSFINTLKLKEVIFSDVLDILDSWSFSYSGVQSLIFPSSLVAIKAYLISSSKIALVDLSKCSKLVSIPSNAFINGFKLSTIKLPKSGCNISIGKSAFQKCSLLKSITIEKSIVSIMDNAFLDSALAVIDFAEGCVISYIGSYAFKNCPLASIKLPDTIREIDEYAFSGCSKLTTVEFGSESRLSTINPYIFNECNITEVKLGKHLCKVLECGFSGCDTLIKIDLFEGNQEFVALGGCLYSKNKSIFIACPPGLQSVEIDKDSTSIAGSAFYECKKLTNVKFDERSTIAEIVPSTFYGCESLSDLTFPKNLQSLHKECFAKCKSLNSVTFPYECQIKIIEQSGFSECGLLSINLQECRSLKTLSKSAFEGCISLKSVIFPPSLLNVESSCFKNCPYLNTIEYCPYLSSDSEFNSLIIGNEAFSGCNALTGIIVPIEYPDNSIGDLPVSRILDGDCHQPTVVFTIQSNSIASPILFLINGEAFE